MVSIFRENKVSRICFTYEDHVTCVILEGAVYVLMEIVHDHLEFLVGVFCWCGFFCCDFIESCFDARIDFRIIKKGTGDGLDAAGTIFV